MRRTYAFLFRPEPEGGYTVTCPALPGLVTYGETLAEARVMADDAMTGLIEVMREHGESVPEGDPPHLVSRYRELTHSLSADESEMPILEILDAKITERV
jgi:predicted RNase H-like HicB family nuclease